MYSKYYWSAPINYIQPPALEPKFCLGRCPAEMLAQALREAFKDFKVEAVDVFCFELGPLSLQLRIH